MKRKFTIPTLLAVIIAAGATIFFTDLRNTASPATEEENNEERARYSHLRWQHEFDMIKDPGLNQVPRALVQQELADALLVPKKQYGGVFSRENNLNTYQPIGPNNIGGRTRAVAFDKRNNQIIIAGCISGGMLRSSDGGNTWIRVTPDGEIHNFSALAQDPRPGSEDIWYAGGGEPIANSASAPGAFYLSEGIWKSTNNGQTWTKLPLTIPGLGNGTLEVFDHPFDIIHRIAVNRANGAVYVAGHRRLIRSLDGGNTWEIAFNTGTIGAGSATGQMDVAITDAGQIYMALNGGFPSPGQGFRGVWTSSNGTTWTRIAGGQTLNVDSVAEWRGNDYVGGSKRILLALAPSNQNFLYVLYENGLTHDVDLKPEVDMYLHNIGTNTWENRSANMPDFPGSKVGVDPIAIQGGYDMLLAVKPDDPTAVFIGGTCLYRSTNGFASTGSTAWIAGYGNTFPTLTIYPNSHPDIHSMAFDPSNASRAICGNDGGIQITSDVMANLTVTVPVNWAMMPNYQTLQYYHIAMDPGSGRNNFMGGAQDNGTQFREDGNNNHLRIQSGDGGSVGFGKLAGTQPTYTSSQLGKMYRNVLTPPSNFSGNQSIEPTGLTGSGGAFGDFVTYFKVNFDNPEDAWYVNFNRLFRTTSASTVTSNTWTEMTGVGSTVNVSGGSAISISAIDFSRGDYFPSHVLYLGTDQGKVYRLDNPRNAAATVNPVEITPPVVTSIINDVNTNPRPFLYISDIAVNPNNDEEIMVVISNYSVTLRNSSGTLLPPRTDFNIWHTTNAKSSSPTWRLAEGTNLTIPSIRSAMIVVKKDGSNNPVTEYYVGTSTGLYSTINLAADLQNGTPVTWVREGATTLNLAVVSALDYRPQDNVLLVGTHGNGLYVANVGTPNFTPNLNTGVNDPVRNDKQFIQSAYPTLVRTKNKIDYIIGNMFTIPRIVIQVYNSAGQLLIRKEDLYRNGSVNVVNLPSGSYVLTITTKDYKQQFVQAFVKE